MFNPPLQTPLPLLLITSPLPACYAPLPTPASFASISLQTDSLGDGGGGRGSWPQRCSHLARECVLCLCVCVCCPVLPLLLTLCQGVFFSFLQIGQKKNVCVFKYISVRLHVYKQRVCVGVTKAEVEDLRGSLGCGWLLPKLQQPKNTAVNKVRLSI